MMVYRGEIWLVNLNPVKKSNEMGKVRPAVVFKTMNSIKVIIQLQSFLEAYGCW